MIVRRFAVLILGFAILSLSVRPVIGQGAGTTDTLRFRNPKKDYAEERATGVATESVGSIKLVAGGKTVVEVPSANVISLEYGSLPGLEKAILELRTAENQGVSTKSRDLYIAEVKKNPADPKTKRFLEYREAVWSIKVVDAKTGDAFKAEATPLVPKLKGFIQDYSKKNAWEVWPISRSTARLQAEMGNYADAASTYAFLSKLDNLPPDLKLEARIHEVEQLFASGNVLNSSTAIEEVGKMPAAGPLKEKVTILQIAIKTIADKKLKTKPEAAVKAIEEIIAKSTDYSVRAMGHNTLGELYIQHDLLRDAMWEFLRVEVVENVDKDEVVRAVFRLGELYQKQGDDTRAKAYREKLPQVKGV
jgi:hypothetical protein